MIKLTHVSKHYDLGGTIVKALDDASVEIKKKEYVAILGTSGSGKSTLMHMIGLLDRPTTGEIEVLGKKTSKTSDDKISLLRNKHIGFVFQQYNLIDKLTVLENVALPTVYAKEKLNFSPTQKAAELLTKVGLSERMNFYPNMLSGGQQQRVAIARSLIMSPELILADEPTGNLDSKTGEEILKLVKELNRKLGVTVVLVTHEKAIGDKADRRIYIKDGKIVKKYL